MSGLRTAAQAYLAMRRTLGFKLTGQGPLLLQFVGYCEQHDLEHITTDAAVDWATHPPRGGNDPLWFARRLMVVRIFARHLATIDPANEVPPADVLPHHARRPAPYIYRPGDIAALLDAAGRLSPPFRAATWQTFLGLLAITGLRVSEACTLDDDDIDPVAGAVVVADTKFGKSRLVFLDSSSITALRTYQQARDERWPSRDGHSLLVSMRGTRLDSGNVQRTFAQLVTAAIPTPVGVRRPRLHDLRHSFAVATLLQWYRDGGDVQARLPLLSTWLGHIDPKSTYYYLQAVPELLTLAAARLNHVEQEQRS